MKHVSRTHRVALDRLFARINLDLKVIKCVESKNQLADILTKGSVTRDKWHDMLHFWNIMNDFRGRSVSMGQSSSSNPTSPGSTSYSQVWNRGERSTNSGCYSVEPASGNRSYGAENAGGVSETRTSGNREYLQKVVQNVKDRLGHNEGVPEVSMDSRRSTSRYGRYLWLHRCRRLCTWIRITRRIWKYSRFLNLKNIESLFNVTNMMIAGNSERKNIFSKDSRNLEQRQNSVILLK